MSLHAGVGLSIKTDSKDAAAEALTAALEQLGEEKPKIVFIFSSYTAFDHKILLKTLKAQLGEISLVGCTTAGELFNDQSLDSSLVLLALASDDVSFYPCVTEGIIKAPQQAATNLANLAKKNLPNMELLIVSGSSFATQGDAVLETLAPQLGPDITVVGGNSGDDLTLKGGYVFLDDKIYADALLGVAVGGNFNFGVGQAYGWKPIGVDLQITKIEGNRIYEIDGKPARQIYEELFGERINELVDPTQILSLLYPMGKQLPNSTECLIRTTVVFHPDGSIEMGGAFAKGDKVKIMLGDAESVIAAARESGKTAARALAPSEAKFVMVFDCISRKRILGDRRRPDEVAALKESFGESVPLVGFYTYGEYAPFRADPTQTFACYHNQALVTLALGD